MNDKKIAFILCVNDETIYRECCSYITDISIPDGYEIDIIDVREATSMAEGYNAAMKASDAKYKVYIHQDVFIIDINFVNLLLEVFEDENIGMCGVVGSDRIVKNGDYANNWNIVNTDLYISSKTTRKNVREYEEQNIYVKNDNYDLVSSVAIDGMLIATQYDIEWDEKTFMGWDYYDISQAFRFKEEGKEIVTIVTNKPLTLHVEGYSVPEKYDMWRKTFCEKYKEYGHNYDYESACINKEYLSFKERRNEFVDKYGIAITSNMDKKQLLEYIKLLQVKIHEIGDEDMPDDTLRLMFILLNIASEDIVYKGYTIFWPINSFIDSQKAFIKILYLLWSNYYKRDEKSKAELNSLVEQKIISIEAINRLKEYYLVKDKIIKKIL